MDATPREIEIYETPEGKRPFSEWLDSLRDSKTQGKIQTRIDRVEEGNLGNYRSVGQGVCELKIDYGSGYRIYFGQIGSTVVLLCGGDKNTQEQDIRKAQEYWEEYKSNENG